MRRRRIAQSLLAVAVIAVLTATALSSLTAGVPRLLPPGLSAPSDRVAGPSALAGGARATQASASVLPPMAAPSSSSDPGPVTLDGGWAGLNYSSSCTAVCLPADPDVATGNGYLFEVTNTAYRVWTTNGTLVLNASLSSLFGSGHDTLTAPQVRYDITTLRWFASVDDLSKGQILYAGSLSSDPAGTWNVQHFAPPGPDVPTQPLLAVDALNLVVTTNLYHAGSFVGAQVWVANKTQLLANMAPNTWSDAPNAATESLVPANPLGSSAVTYLVSDGIGGAHFDVFTLTGSPPATPTLSGPAAFASMTSSPPAASQLGTSNLVSVEDARVQNAVWHAGVLWAAANVACTPSGDSTPRSCLHLWEFSTATSTMLQDFNWSTGAGTSDFFPAVSVDSLGNLALVFEQSSGTSYPSVEVTAQTITEAAGTLEPAQTIKAGGGPDNVTGMCPLSVCPFGNYSGAAASPSTNGNFWLVGEYTGADFAMDYWHTWVRLVTLLDTYAVSFTESNLPAGTPWSVTVNGVVASSTSPTVEFNETNGAYTFTVVSPIAGTTGTQFVTSPASGSFSVTSAPYSEAISYTEQFQLTTSVGPAGAGTVSPSGGWFNASAPVNLSALATAGHAFADWDGTGPGSYSGTSNPAAIELAGPVSEQAQFSTSVTFEVTFTESGLPVGTTWSVLLNGIADGSTGSALTFNEPNGSYSFSTTSPVGGGPGIQFIASPTVGSFAIGGSGFSQSVSYITQFELTISPTPATEGTVEPGSGWFDAGSVVNLTALAGPGYQFDSWGGTGAGNYTGVSNPASLTLRAPTSEVAAFATVSPSNSFVASGLLLALIIGLALVAFALSVTLLVVVLRRRRRPPPPLHPVSPPSIFPSAPLGARGEEWRED